jgi:CheY-like chemotaxis protein
MDQTVPRGQGEGQRKIIVSEDEVLVRIVLADALRHEGFEVIEAVDADDAIAALKFNAGVSLRACCEEVVVEVKRVW